MHEDEDVGDYPKTEECDKSMINDTLYEAVNAIEVQLAKHPDRYTLYYDQIMEVRDSMENLRKQLDVGLGVREE
jgi:hypothetical protein